MKFTKIESIEKVKLNAGQYMRQYRMKKDDKQTRAEVAEWAEAYGCDRVYVMHTHMGALFIIVV